MHIEQDIKLDFCDVLIRPKRSLPSLGSRKDIDLVRSYKFLHYLEDIDCGIPIIIANMDSVGTIKMAESISLLNGWTCLHKHYEPESLGKAFEKWSSNRKFYTLGTSDKDFEKLDKIHYITGFYPTFICLDVANGYTQKFVDSVVKLRSTVESDSVIMAGNVCTPDMTQELLLAGADIVKVGIGPGSVCETRRVTGVGYPQLSAILECADVAHGMRGHICADGGCKDSGDVSKAFAAGADFVMLGGMFAGCDECEGEWEYYQDWDNPFGGQKEKKMELKFYGMSSKEANDKYNGGLSDYKASEGKCITVPYKGFAKDVFQEICGGIRSTCMYVGAERLKDLSKCTTFVRVNRIQ